MIQVHVTARTNPTGKIIPLRISWQGKDLPILGIGRRWFSSDAEHLLVMVPGDRVIELLYRHDQSWTLKPIPGLGKHWFV